MKSMLGMKKNFIGLAVLATLFTGCQTAQKNDFETVNLDEMFPGYGSDRRPASVTPLLDEVYKALKGVKTAAHAGVAEKEAQAELLNYVNRLRTPEVAALKKETKGGRITKDDLARLLPETQAKIASDFLASRGLNKVQELRSIRAKVQDEMARIGGTDARTANAAMAAKLKTSSGAIDKNVKVRTMSDQVAKNGAVSQDANVLNRSFKDLEEVLSASKSDADARRVKQKIFEARMAAGRVYDLTGDSHLIPETCNNLDEEVLPQYTRLLDDISDYFKKYSTKGEKGRWKMVSCKNKDEMTAYVAAKFQEVMGRRGPAALTAVKEMTFCNYLKPTVGNAADVLASRGFDLSKAPDCQ
jgi:hypothetical protein